MENSFLNDDDLAEWERRNEEERLEAEENKQRFALDLARVEVYMLYLSLIHI